MLNYRYSVTPKEVNALRKAIGFRQLDEEQIQNGLNGSSYIGAVYDDDQLVGVSRLI